MKRSLFLVPFVLMAFFSCKKDTSDLISSSLDGTWKMILVKDNAANTAMTKPASLYGDVIVTFVSGNLSGGVFKGNTPTNEVGPNNYSLGPNQEISIPSLNMTKVGETSWGLQFVVNFRDAQQYRLEPGDLLSIITTGAKTLTFQKI